MDESAFRALFDEQFDLVWRFARRRLASASDADDVTADAFAVAWRRRADVPDGHEARLWLFGTVRHVLANHHHRSTRRRSGLQDRLEQQPSPGPPGPAGPEDLIVVRESNGVWQALATLSEADRDLLIMRAWDELAVTDIAQLLDCTPNAASVRLHKARRKLAEALAEQPPTGDDGRAARSTAEPGSAVGDRTDPTPSRTSRERTANAEGEGL